MELLTLLLAPDTLYEYTNIREAIPPRKSLFGREYLNNPKTQEIIDLWLRYGRPAVRSPTLRPSELLDSLYVLGKR